MYADVIIPVPILKLYTYEVPQEVEKLVAEGSRVVVHFGKSNLVTGIIRKLHNTPPPSTRGYFPKPIEVVLDHYPIVNDLQFRFWDWLCDYYLCAPGEVLSAALPSGLRLSAETVISIAPDTEIEIRASLKTKKFEADETGKAQFTIVNEHFPVEVQRRNSKFLEMPIKSLNEKEIRILEALETKKKLSLKDVSKIIERKTVYPLVKSMLEKQLITIEKEIVRKYKSKMIQYVRLTEDAAQEKRLEEIVNSMNRSPKQLQILLTFITISKRYSKEPVEVQMMRLTARSAPTTSQMGGEAVSPPFGGAGGAVGVGSGSRGVIAQLVKKGIFEIYEKEDSRIKEKIYGAPVVKKLTDFQETAMGEIEKQFREKEVVLLHGVTSSGKTEVYIRLIAKMLAYGKQSLYLLPEIALTSQIINRLAGVFGNSVVVYHSRLSENERVETWQKILGARAGAPLIILGARSALLLPVSNLGLVIVDEEHDHSFKQENPAPRYNGRDASIYLASLFGAKVLLGSATPSIESYYNAKTGKYGFVRMDKRFGEALLPEIEIVNIADEKKKKRMKSHFSARLMELAAQALERKEQVLLFQNRRGFSPMLMCDSCGWIPQCDHCDVSLVYHKKPGQIKCHYCGFSHPVPRQCPACGETVLLTKGFGTEQIEENIRILFPAAKVDRMDMDTTKKKDSHQRIINDFENGDIDILIGTQMITKGLDFDRVSVVGILNADAILGFPDFRAFERGFQLMAQVSGRAGRKLKGKVVIQTYKPGHPVILNVLKNEYEKMYATELLQRQTIKYPPFCRIVGLKLKHKNFEKVRTAANRLSIALRASLGDRVLGPFSPPVIRIANFYLQEILIKLERGGKLKAQKETIRKAIRDFQSVAENRPVRIVADVDPVTI